MYGFIIWPVLPFMAKLIYPEYWESFKIDYGKNYSSTFEEQQRYLVFKQNKEYIDVHNRLYKTGEITYELGLNDFADKTKEEYQELLSSYDQDESDRSTVSITVPANVTPPEAIDWRARGAVTPIQNQGHCGSGWAFSTAGIVEGQRYLKTGKLVPLSAQNLVDCSQSFGNEGCSRGRPVKALRYIMANQGICRELEYPYKAIEGNCKFHRSRNGTIVKGVINLPRDNECDLLKATAFHGPISIILDASLDSFKFYKQGIYDDPNCDPNKLNHAMLVVGYGSQSGLDYWLLKNSYGEKWGERGYMKIIRNKNRCGIANEALLPLL